MEEISVNDGKGFFDNLGLIDTLIVDCNELLKDLMNGQNVRFCKRVVDMVQKLSNLKNGIQNDFRSMTEQIKELTERNDADVMEH